MDIETSISDILREVIKFLECLHDVKLPLAQESLRQKLVMILKNKLTTMTRVSPEPYLNMVPGPKSLLQHTLPKSETDSEDYVEPSQKQIKIPIGADQNYYERVGANSQIVATVASESSERSDDQDENRRLIEIYKNLSATQAKGKCHKCGPLHRKEGKKLFLSESRACWIALVGSHLLIYRNEKTSRPHAIYPVRCYMARPAPNLIPRDRQKSESAFEIYSPGSETLQFIARTPKDMDQWIAKICEVGHDNENEKGVAEVCKKKHAAVESQTNPDETVRDAKKSTDKPTKIDTTSDKKEVERKDINENPPPLPARIPRRLPSLPSDDAIASYKPAAKDDDDEDDIYHKIEDLKNGTCYQNVALPKTQSDANDKKHETTYDDIRSSKEKNQEQVFLEETTHDTTPPEEELYDDIGTISRTGNVITGALPVQQIRNSDRPVADGEKKREEFYDDVDNLIPNERFIKDRAKNQTEASKFLQKKSFLDRVLSRKESSGKLDKKYKSKVSSLPSPSTTEKTPTCIDASNLTPNQESLAEEREELPEYNCPPPPRPIYTKSLNNPNRVEEFYDDVSACREQYNKSRPTIPESMLEGEAKKIVNNTTCNAESKDESSQEEILHYQSPRSDLRIPDAAEVQPNEELYDDIALLADFTARQRDNIRKKDGEDAKSIIAPDKKSWNRFVNKKLRASDSNCSEINRPNSECEESEDSSENNSVIKRNTFQKLINRMENSLAKVSARNSPSLPPSQSSTTNNNS
ncbi:muscle M-line assembly protein unc-89 [Linepithema humile]|uniref:muscle M-line assembly protein unc-89 n=1 Tax=Linepithema humile TaxID=83485 RepID=UPI0006234314|nr:PREDICTED: uncharacterized protein LOC105667494 [Linepithema humile]